MNRKAISDPEGYDITTFATKSDNYLIVGDLLDSTSPMTDFLSEAKIDYFNLKSNNLKNIYTILNNKNFVLLFGNRDLNKIKCHFLHKLINSTNKDIIKQFNTGSINLDEKTHQLLLKAVGELPWEIPNMNNWYTFWAKDIGSKGKKNWTETLDYTKYPFLQRFSEIFGADNIMGTMSAYNLLYTIPNEIGKFQITKGNFTEIADEKKDYYAFIVLALFNSMLKISPLDEKKISSFKINNSSAVTGWLYNLYTDPKNNVCLIYKNLNDIFLYSHGGITELLVSLFINGKLEDTLPYSLKINEDLSTKSTGIIEYLVDASKLYETLDKTGGSLSKLNHNVYTYNDISRLCEYVNKKCKDHIKSIFESITMLIPNSSMLFILLLTSEMSCDNFPVSLQTKCNESTLDIKMVSPIVTGLYNMRENYFYIELPLYQIIGHLPLGYSASIDKYNKEQLTTYLINLDASNTFYSSNANQIINHQILSKTILTENSGLKSVISINLIKMPLILFDKLTQFNESFIVDGKLKHNEHLIISRDLYDRLIKLHDYRFNVSINFNQLSGIDKVKDRLFKSGLVINYQGTTIDNKITYYVLALSCKTIRFQKNLLILNEDDFNTFTQFRDNSMKHKYLKYKMKYFNLKMLL
jgi:hypothetical protein